jgi:hypothetical protein
MHDGTVNHERVVGLEALEQTGFDFVDECLHRHRKISPGSDT